jgi:hypothetical protein
MCAGVVGDTVSTIRERQAPLGIEIFCLIGGLSAVAAILLNLRLLGSGGSEAALGVIFVAVSVGILVVLAGLLGLQSWAWTATMVLLGLNIVLSLVRLAVVGAILGLVALGYIYQQRSLYRG